MPRDTMIAVIWLGVIAAAASAAGRGVITRPSCYLTTEDRTVNLAVLGEGLVVELLATGPNGRHHVRVPVGDARVRPARGWKGQSLPEGEGWVSHLFLKVDAIVDAPVTSGTAAAPPVAQAPQQSLGGRLMSLLGIGFQGPGVAQAAGSVAGKMASATAGADAPRDAGKGPPPPKVRNLLEESRTGTPVIVINIPAQRLRVYRKGALAMDVACRVGQKEHADYAKTGENSRTRVGENRIRSWHQQYSNATYGKWTGSMFNVAEMRRGDGAFGAWTAKLDDPSGQFIHGTFGAGPVDWAMINMKWMVGGSHGCVRLRNTDVTRLQQLCPEGSRVMRVYTLREGSRTLENLYAYADTEGNGSYDPEKGELIGYRHPKGAVGSGR